MAESASAVLYTCAERHGVGTGAMPLKMSCPSTRTRNSRRFFANSHGYTPPRVGMPRAAHSASIICADCSIAIRMKVIKLFVRAPEPARMA